MWPILVGQRGIHDIDDEITFAGNPGYVFHDSCGIECGSSDEVDKLKSFIEGRAHTGDFAERLHVIWLVDLLERLYTTDSTLGSAFRPIAIDRCSKEGPR